MPRVLVAGGTGFLGRAFVAGLADEGAHVRVLTRRPERAAGAYPGLSATFVGGDVTTPESLVPAMADVDTAVLTVQFSGYPVESASRGRTFLDVDARGTAALAEAAREAGVRKLVYLSGVGADPHAGQVWYRAKGMAEASVQASGLTWTIIRPSWVYGPDDVSLNRFIGLIRAVPLVFPQLGPGTQRVTPIHVEDLASLVCDVATGSDADGRVLEAGGPQVLTLDEIVSIAMRVLGRRKPILHIPLGLAKLGAAMLELLPGQILSRDAVEFVTQDGVADRTAIREVYPDFEPREFEGGLRGYLG